MFQPLSLLQRSCARAFVGVAIATSMLACVGTAWASDEGGDGVGEAASEVAVETNLPRSKPVEEADRLEPLPARLKGVDVSEQLGKPLPLDAELRDSDGKSVRLAQFFDGKRPVILTFNYSDCPMLCSLQLSRFVQTLAQMKRTVGSDFEVVTVSIDPAETVERARETKSRYLRDYGRPEAASG